MNHSNIPVNKLRLSALLLITFCFFLSCANTADIKSEYPVQSNPEYSDTNSDKENVSSLSTKEYPQLAQKQTNDTIQNISPGDPGTALPYGGDYVIGPEDLLEINVYQVDELNETVRVSSSGFIKLPLTGLIKASGLTARELEAEIGKSLEKYLQEPLVSIFIKEYRGQNITILGAIQNPQVYSVTQQKYLLDLISLSGGLTNDAGDICFVRRGNETIIINIKDLLIGGNMRLNIPVFAGDIIHVPIGGIVFVDGAVYTPGSFSMRGTITITQAIAMAKGLKFEAVRDQIRIYRDSGKAEREIIEVDYDAIMENKSPDINLKDKDVVIVAKSGVKSAWSGFVRSLSGAFRFGSVSLGAGY